MHDLKISVKTEVELHLFNLNNFKAVVHFLCVCMWFTTSIRTPGVFDESCSNLNVFWFFEVFLKQLKTSFFSTHKNTILKLDLQKIAPMKDEFCIQLKHIREEKSIENSRSSIHSFKLPHKVKITRHSSILENFHCNKFGI